MPLVRREVFQLLLLMSVVPLQYFLSSKVSLSFNQGSKSQVVKDIIDHYNSITEKVTASKLWKTLKVHWLFQGKIFSISVF